MMPLNNISKLFIEIVLSSNLPSYFGMSSFYVVVEGLSYVMEKASLQSQSSIRSNELCNSLGNIGNLL
jgi:hypothetical protein